MRIGSVSARALLEDSQSLSPHFHVPADQGADDLVAGLAHATPLEDLCVPGGLFRGPIFRRIFAPDPAFGRPYVTATDLEQAEIRPAAFLSCLHGALLDQLALRQDTIVVSCSGMNLGKAFYVRPDMHGYVGSHDLIRVVPDTTRIRPGYLFAYLDSRYGRSALRKSTHGGSVRHIEPAGIASLRTPRLADADEARIDSLVRDASRRLSRHAGRLEEATGILEGLVGLSELDAPSPGETPEQLGWREYGADDDSLRALNFDPRANAIRTRLTAGVVSRLGELCDPAYFRGKQVFKREDASEDKGVPLLGQRAAFRLRPEGRYLSRVSVEKNRLRVPAGTVLIPSHGTLGARELYCRALMVTQGLSTYAFSGDFFRCVPLPDRIRPGYLYAFLRSRHAFRLLRSLSSGGKQQELSIQRMADLPVPRLADADEQGIAELADQAAADYDAAVSGLKEARLTVEAAVRDMADRS